MHRETNKIFFFLFQFTDYWRCCIWSSFEICGWWEIYILPRKHSLLSKLSQFFSSDSCLIFAVNYNSLFHPHRTFVAVVHRIIKYSWVDFENCLCIVVLSYFSLQCWILNLMIHPTGISLPPCCRHSTPNCFHYAFC